MDVLSLTLPGRWSRAKRDSADQQREQAQLPDASSVFHEHDGTS
jgi:hypothetical protein